MRMSAIDIARWLAATIRPAAAEQGGFMLIEILVAVTILSVGILGLGLTLDTSRKLSLVSERHATMTHVAQREIESVEGLAYSQVGEAQAPGPHSTNPANPDYYLVDGSPPSYQWDRSGSSAEQVDVDPAGQVTPVKPWSEGGMSGQVYEFVTWAKDPKCAPGCPAAQDYKRITVGVTMAGGLHPNPVYVSSVMSDPQATPSGGCQNGSCGNPLQDPRTHCKDSNGNTVLCTSPIDNGNPNTWFPCDTSAASPSCIPPTCDHTLHDTVGSVSGVAPVPDLMQNTPPSTPSQTCSNPPCPSSSSDAPAFNYSSDLGSGNCGRVIQPTCTGSSGCGIGSTSDCNNGAFSNLLVNAQSEMWVTNPLTASMTLNGEGGFSMFTSALGGANGVVSFCIEIYDVSPTSFPNLPLTPPTDLGGAGYVAATDPSTGGNWPTSLTQVNYIFNFRGSNGAVTVPIGHRIGFRVWMKAN